LVSVPEQLLLSLGQTEVGRFPQRN